MNLKINYLFFFCISFKLISFSITFLTYNLFFHFLPEISSQFALNLQVLFCNREETVQGCWHYNLVTLFLLTTTHSLESKLVLGSKFFSLTCPYLNVNNMQIFLSNHLLLTSLPVFSNPWENDENPISIVLFFFLFYSLIDGMFIYLRVWLRGCVYRCCQELIWLSITSTGTVLF